MNPFDVLGLEDNCDDAAVHAAYLEAIRRSPPDRDPQGFQKARAAYEQLRDARSRLNLRLFGMPRPTSFAALETTSTPKVPVIALEHWQALLSTRKGNG